MPRARRGQVAPGMVAPLKIVPQPRA